MKTLELKVVKDWESSNGRFKLRKGETALYLPEIEEQDTYRIAVDIGVTASIPKEYFESPIIAGLREYLDNATPEQLEKDWEELEPFNGFGPDAAEYLQNQYDKNHGRACDSRCQNAIHSVPPLTYLPTNSG